MDLLPWMSLTRVLPSSFLLLWCCCTNSFAGELFRNNTDRLALLNFKSQITQDPLRIMNSWNDSLHFCEWPGVICGRRHRRVVKLNLQFHGLVGYISPYIGNLSFLRVIYLQDNAFQGEIPQEIGRLYRLQHLNLTNNSLIGEIPTSLTNCSDLRSIHLHFNSLVGTIPILLGSLSKLVFLYLFSNSLTGSIPPSLGNLSYLQQLSLGSNSLEGSIPDSLRGLTSLIFFGISENRISGMVPPWLFNHSSLEWIVIPQNQLLGRLPPDISVRLPNLKELSIGSNQLTGSIPTSLSNSSELQILDTGSSNFTGSVSINFGGLQHLWWLNLAWNNLGQGEADDLSFLNSLTNCSHLKQLMLYHNNFGGILPNSVANLSKKLEIFAIGDNQIVGSIPVGIENLVNLTVLSLELNYFTGSIPSGVGKLQNLHVLFLNFNFLSEQIPSSIGNLTQLLEVHLEKNNFTGSIPWSIENCKNLQVLSISQNYLNGSIPKQVIRPPSLISLKLAHNSLTGSIPVEVGILKNLELFDISENKLSGEIPSSLGECLSLEGLHLEGNFFQGNIPSSLGSLRVIQDLDLSRNNLSGKIPRELESLSILQSLNLSLNDLEGEVPSKGAFKNASVISIFGNIKLCGGISELQLPACSFQESKKHGKAHDFKVIISLVGVLVSVILVTSCIIIFYWRRKPRKKPSTSFSIVDPHLRVSYGELLKATDGFSVANLIGVGSYGSVYKGVLDQYETMVAVKVLNLQQRGASKSFMSECKALKSIRHRNLLKILTTCSSVDFEGNEFKALVLDFMPNGSLESWLHPFGEGQQHDLKSFDLVQRLNIAIDVASALDYLHHGCQTTIVHSDLKPSNVLLNDDMTAHVGDFGLAKVLSISSDSFGQIQSNSIAIKGSVGYVAPEYGMGRGVSTYGDVYSYGILLLEMFTGLRPTNDIFKDDLNLHNFVKMALPERVEEIVDLRLLSIEEENAQATDIVFNQSDKRRQMWECLVSVLRIGVACSMESPIERMEMNNAVGELCLIRDIYRGHGIRGERQN